uniref:Uncharacterized protein n=1 Tax=Dunaliella tertiolecta TaxID=3047 RepID=A0A7S3VJU9_DUNTE|mmetsp:Transcript_3786/g.8779  ORF Transcript_3786/g.8779 Transcript_3786/m.8779 type:complete len:165 (-) Transcript_3786:309-803(-)
MSRSGSTRGLTRAGSARGADKGVHDVISSTNKLLAESENRQAELKSVVLQIERQLRLALNENAALCKELGRAPKKAAAMTPPLAPPADPQAASELASLQAKILQLEQQLQHAKLGGKNGGTSLNQLAVVGAGQGKRRDIWNRFKANVEATKQTLPAIFKKCAAV